MKKLILLPLILLSSCFTDNDSTTKTLERNGYTPIEVGGYSYTGDECLYSTKFKAVAPNGDTVTGCVTKGVFKGNTIRLDD